MPFSLAQTQLVTGAALEDALAFAKNHASGPDIRTYEPPYTMEMIRALIGEAERAPFQSDHKFFILDQAEDMLPAAANALLKTLEEPLASIHFILLTNDEKKILPTIRSRAIKVHMSSKQSKALDEIEQILAVYRENPDGDHVPLEVAAKALARYEMAIKCHVNPEAALQELQRQLGSS